MGPFPHAKGEREPHALLKVLVDTRPNLPSPCSQLILSLGYYQEGASQSSMTEKEKKMAQYPQGLGWELISLTRSRTNDLLALLSLGCFRKQSISPSEG